MSNEFALAAQKFAGSGTVKKLVGSTPDALRKPLIVALIWPSSVLPSAVLCNGLLLAAAQVLYSALLGFAAVGGLLKMSVPPPTLGYTLNTGWLNAFSASTRNWILRLLSPRRKFFCSEASKSCCHGPRAPSSVRGALPYWPSGGRSNNEGFTYGWQFPPTGQLRS